MNASGKGACCHAKGSFVSSTRCEFSSSVVSVGRLVTRLRSRSGACNVLSVDVYKYIVFILYIDRFMYYVLS